jgi:transposase
MALIIILSIRWEKMPVMPHQDAKLNALHAAHAVHPHSEAVTDPLFSGEQRFFDARDLVQVKYEMLRRVQVEGRSVSQTAPTFGFTRPTFYAAQAAWQEGGLPGLLPERPGPRAAHKLTEPVLTFLDDLLTEDPTLHAAQLAERLHEQFGLVVHPRSIQRALGRRVRKRSRGGD